MPSPGRLRRGAVAFGLSFGTLLAQIAVVATIPYTRGLQWWISSPIKAVAVGVALVLAAMAGWAYLRVLRCPDYHPDRPAAIRAFLLGSALDVLWTALFWLGRHPTISLLTTVVLLAVAATVVWRFKAVDRRAAVLVAPRFLLTDASLYLVASFFFAHLQTASPT